MPTITENKQIWDGNYRWDGRGDEWSAPWGGTEMQWYGMILPRIQRLIPADCIVEIACGFGRWTQFLKNQCKELVAIDLSEECISACRERFAHDSHVECHVNDGKSLSMVSDASANLVFSFDSLVHVDRTVLESYISQLSRILTADGAAFIHHSNLGEYQSLYSRVRRVPKLEGALRKIGVLERTLHWRDFSVSAGVVEEIAARHGMKCISQEIVPWRTKRFQIDCFSTLVKAGSPLDRKNVVYRNRSFMKEASSLARLAPLYMSPEPPPS
ncbi:MAG: class I SAM-dependent methyltransferase [Planctomycetaceae bacterium]